MRWGIGENAMKYHESMILFRFIFIVRCVGDKKQ